VHAPKLATQLSQLIPVLMVLGETLVAGAVERNSSPTAPHVSETLKVTLMLLEPALTAPLSALATVAKPPVEAELTECQTVFAPLVDHEDVAVLTLSPPHITIQLFASCVTTVTPGAEELPLLVPVFPIPRTPVYVSTAAELSAPVTVTVTVVGACAIFME
jgi:hypothetical protein